MKDMILWTVFILGTAFFFWQNQKMQKHQLIDLRNSYHKKFENLDREMYDLRVELQSNKRKLAAYASLHPYINLDTRKDLWDYMKVQKVVPGNRFKIDAQVKDVKINMSMYAALLSYTGPMGILTSMKRKTDTGSYHQTGKAVDIRWNTDVADWLMSTEGRVWANNHGLRILFENVSSKKYKESDYYIYNENATAPHIHVELRRPVKTV